MAAACAGLFLGWQAACGLVAATLVGWQPASGKNSI